MAFAVVVAREPVARFCRRGAGPDKDKLVFGNAGGARLCQRGEDNGGALIDVRVGDHALWIGPGDHSVVGSDVRDLLRRQRRLRPGVGVVRGGGRIARPEKARFRLRLRGRLAPGVRGRGFIERIDIDRPGNAELVAQGVNIVRRTLHLRGVNGVRRPGQVEPSALGVVDGVLRLGAGDEADIAFPLQDAPGSFVEVTHRALAPDRAIEGPGR